MVSRVASGMVLNLHSAHSGCGDVQRRRQDAESLLGPAAEHLKEEILHRAEVVVHELRLQAGPLGDPT